MARCERGYVHVLIDQAYRHGRPAVPKEVLGFIQPRDFDFHRLLIRVRLADVRGRWYLQRDTRLLLQSCLPQAIWATSTNVGPPEHPASDA